MRVLFAIVAVLLCGCPGDPRLAVVNPPDADVFAMHAPDGHDATDAVSEPAPVDGQDAVVDAGVSDAVDAPDVVDGADAAVDAVADAPDTTDVPDGADSSDAADAADTAPSGSATYEFCGDGGHCIGADRCLGPSSARVPYCAHTCTLNSDCPAAPTGSMTTAYCGSTSTGSWCELLCTAGVSTCPTGLECLAGTCQ